MVKVTDTSKTVKNIKTMKAVVSLFADSKSDVENATEADILEFPKDYTIDWGSSAMTADGEVGFLKSNGTWNWL